MNRAERRRKERNDIKSKENMYTYKESELREIIEKISNEREDYYYHISTKLLITCALHSLKKEFKFGQQRLSRFITAITEIYLEVSENEEYYKMYEKELKKMGFSFKFLQE